MRRNGEAIGGTQPTEDVLSPLPVARKPTQRGERLYVYATMRPYDTLTLSGVPVNRVDRVSVLGDGEALAFTAIPSLVDVHSGSTDPRGELEIAIPAHLNDELIPVIAIDLRQ